MATARPLPQPPIKSLNVERKKKSRKTTESKKAGVTADLTSVSSSKDGFLPLPQVKAMSIPAEFMRFTGFSEDTLGAVPQDVKQLSASLKVSD